MALEVNDKNFNDEVLESEYPVLVDFWAPWCGPCRTVGPVIEEIDKEYKGKLKVCKVNVDEASSTSDQYNVMSIPTLVVFKAGKEVCRTVGAQGKGSLENLVKPYL